MQSSNLILLAVKHVIFKGSLLYFNAILDIPFIGGFTRFSFC